MRDGIAELSARLVKVPEIVCETPATGKPTVKTQEWQKVDTILMKCKQKHQSQIGYALTHKASAFSRGTECDAAHKRMSEG